MIALSLSWHRLAAAAACWIGLAVPGSTSEPVTPLQVVPLETYESQVEEGGQAARWLIRHSAGLRQIDIETGNSMDVTFKRIASGVASGFSGQLLTNDGKFFGHLSYGDGGERSIDGNQELTIGRSADGEVIVKLRPDEMLKLWGEVSPSNCYLADDASHLWCRNRDDEVFRIDLAPEPRVVAKVKLKGRTRDTFHIFATGSQPVVVAATCSNGAGLFQMFDGDLQPLASRQFSEPAVVLAGTSQPRCLLVLSFPKSTRWQVIALEGNEFKLVSSGSLRSKWPLRAAAISPDAKYLVTSQPSERRTIAVWNLATGALVREVELTGGVAELRGRNDRTITHLAFSKSGKYLTASDRLNAYLLEVPKLLAPTTTGKSAQD